MIITCQNCQTHYSVNLNALSGGRNVQCGNCGNSWYQNPVQTPEAMAPQPVYAEQMAPAQPVQPAPAPPPPPEPETVPEPVPEPEPEPAPEPKVAEEGQAEAPEQGAESVGEEDALSLDQLDKMFGEDIEPDAFFGGDDAGNDEGKSEPIDPDQLPEPDPIPKVSSVHDEDTDGDADAKKGSGKIIGITTAVALIALGSSAFFGRGFIIDLWPQASDYFAMVGLGGDELGAGLDIRNVKSSREVENGIDVLVIRGTVANIAEEDRMVPMIRVSLYDGEGVEVQQVIAAPLKSRIPPGAKIGFKAKLSEISALAGRLEVTFAEEKKPGD